MVVRGCGGDCSCRIVSYSNAADTDSVSPILSSAWASPSTVTVTDGDDAEVDKVVAMAELFRVETFMRCLVSLTLRDHQAGSR